MTTLIPIVITRTPSFSQPSVFRTTRRPAAPQTVQSSRSMLRVPRTRRISSSGAAKRFPKDFFKDEQGIIIREGISRVSQPKSSFINAMDRPQEHPLDDPQHNPTNNLANRRLGHCLNNPLNHHNQASNSKDHQHHKNETELERIETPKFNNRGHKTEGRRTKIEKYLSQKQQQFASKKSIMQTINHPLGVYNSNVTTGVYPSMAGKPLEQKCRPEESLTDFPMISNFNVTLGKNTLSSFITGNNKTYKAILKQKTGWQHPWGTPWLAAASTKEKENLLARRPIKIAKGLMWMRSDCKQGFRVRKQLLS